MSSGDRPRDHAGARRVAALAEHRLLSGEADPALEAVVRLAAAVAGVPTATLNLVDDRAQHQVAAVGFTGAASACEDSMCARTIALGVPVHVPDASLDPRFADSPWVDGRRDTVRLYAAHPLTTTTGVVVGTLCVFDTRPGELSADQRAQLADLAVAVMALFERRRQSAAQLHLVAAAEEARDLVELAHAELALRLDELERSNAELEQFAAVASHDLRAPLAVVDGYLELLEDLHAADEQGPARAWVATARGGVRRMTSLIDALLGHAAAGARVVAAEPVDVGEVLEVVLADLGPTIAATGAEVVLVDPLPVVTADPVQLHQVLANLVGNALKFARPGTPGRVRCSVAEHDDAWVLSVSDDGRGIPAERRASVFAMFERAGTGHAVPGHGIGLATCERIVARHGGRIWAEETPGGGTTVRFTLPRPTPVAVPAPRTSAADRSGAGAGTGGAPVAQRLPHLVAQGVDARPGGQGVGQEHVQALHAGGHPAR